MGPAIVTAEWDSPLGPLFAGATDEGVCCLEFDHSRPAADRRAALGKAFGRPVVSGSNAHLDRLRAELDDYFVGRLTAFRTPVVYPGTEFQRKVWSELLRIPYGATRSYADVARAVGAANGSRAVGRANGQNRIAIVIPCHRVVNTGGALGGYGGGLWRKEYMLELERYGSGKEG